MSSQASIPGPCCEWEDPLMVAYVSKMEKEIRVLSLPRYLWHSVSCGEHCVYGGYFNDIEATRLCNARESQFSGLLVQAVRTLHVRGMKKIDGAEALANKGRIS